MRISEEKWYAMTEEEVCNELCASREGLTHDEVKQRLAQYGTNALPVKKPPTLNIRSLVRRLSANNKRPFLHGNFTAIFIF